MKARKSAPTLLAATLLAAGIGNAIAQTPQPQEKDLAERQKELAAAQAELQRAAQKVAELSRTTIPDAARQLQQAQQWFQVARKPVIGVVLTPDDTAGVRVGGVTPDSAAAKAGLKTGDRIVSIDGSEILGDSAGLRVDNARRLFDKLEENRPVKIGYVRDGRKATASVTPQRDGRVFVFNDDGSLTRVAGPATVRRRKDGAIEIDGDAMEGSFRVDADRIQKQANLAIAQAAAEIGRIDAEGNRAFAIAPLAEAFRWNGLNLAAVDPQLGRYFGTDRGVLVVSAGEDMSGLQAGDVIRRIDGKEVQTPREAMAALRAKPADSQVAVELLRDHKNVGTRIKVPKAMPFRIPEPPAPPVPPAPQVPPPPPAVAAPASPSAPPAPPVPPAPPPAALSSMVRMPGALASI
jgi:membrane-associated protease RseP (regulator of RpoE activity)